MITEGNLKQRSSPGRRKLPHSIAGFASEGLGAGLRFGVYSDSGQQTCGGNTGSLGYEKEDAAQFAAWGVDLLKYDDCFIPSPEEARPALAVR